MRHRVSIGDKARTFHNDDNSAADGYRQYGRPEGNGGRERKDIDATDRFVRIDAIRRRQQARQQRQAHRNQRADEQCSWQAPQDSAFNARRLAVAMQSFEVLGHGVSSVLAQASMSSLSTEDDAPADDGFQYDGVTNFLWFDAGQVAIDQYHVGEHARL